MSLSVPAFLVPIASVAHAQSCANGQTLGRQHSLRSREFGQPSSERRRSDGTPLCHLSCMALYAIDVSVAGAATNGFPADVTLNGAVDGKIPCAASMPVRTKSRCAVHCMGKFSWQARFASGSIRKIRRSRDTVNTYLSQWIFASLLSCSAISRRPTLPREGSCQWRGRPWPGVPLLCRWVGHIGEVIQRRARREHR